MTGLAAPKAGRHLLHQIAVATRIGLSTLPQRIKNGLVIVIGIGSMVFVLLSILSIGEGAKLTLLGSGDPGNAMVHGSGGDVMHPWIEEQNVSFLDRNPLPPATIELVSNAPGVRRTADGTKLIDEEISLDIKGLTKRNNNGAGTATVLGVERHWTALYPTFRLLSGRLPQPGAHEVMAGDLARQKFREVDKGFIAFAGLEWRVVGIFRSDELHDGQFVGDAAALKTAIHHVIDTTVLARLVSPDAFGAFRQAVQEQSPKNVHVEREADHYAGIWQDISQNAAAFLIAYTLAGLIGAGMVAGTMLTMQVAIESRAQEIAILRAIGFGGFAVAASTVAEAMILATCGSLAATALVWLWLDGFVYGGGGVITVRVDLHMLLVGVAWALSVALIGTLRPAIQAARQTPIEALREV